jgi:Domain of unknown function (DUF892)
MQRIEHYEIAACYTDVALARALCEKEVADLLSQTLAEEKQIDPKLAEVTQKAIMPAALAGEEEEGGCLPPATAKRRDSRCPNLARRAPRCPPNFIA